MTLDEHVSRDITFNVSVDNLRHWAIAGIYQGLRSTGALKNSDEVQGVQDFNWAGMNSLPESILPLRLKIEGKKEVFASLNGEKGEEL